MEVMVSQGGALAQDTWRGRLRYDEPLARHATFHIGGPADIFVVAESEQELLTLVRLAREQELEFLVLGGGSNVLVSDRGVSGLVILNRASEVHLVSGGEGPIPWPAGPELPSSGQRPTSYVLRAGAEADHAVVSGPAPGSGGRRVAVNMKPTLHAASGAFLSRLAREAARRALGGLEWAVGIPGTLGGAIVQNAGAHGSCMADIVLQVKILDQAGLVRTLDPEELDFGYRTSRFRRQGTGSAREVILSADLQLRPRSQGELEACMAEYIAQRRARQPWLPSAGSVFKNPPGDYAARLIEAAGLKGMRQGDAMIAPEHADFIVNVGNARASDVKALIDRTHRAVSQRFGVELELEIQLVGDWHGSCNS